ncbi:hypothetical protein DFH28DRAFT_1136419 [Melampsora americana]|nr:hypothetical protein DFH28DRAFT_1136419 [Melampsora americana]
MLARAFIVVVSTFSVLLSISVDAQHHVLNDHVRREADTNQNHSFEKGSSHNSSRRRRSTHSSPLPSFSPVKREFLDTLLADGSDNNLNEGFLQGILHGVPDYNACRIDGPIPAASPGDPPFTQGRLSYEKAITCPHGTNAPNGVVLLIPGTACDAAQTYARGPFGIGLPRAGFAVCWIDLPGRLTLDIQLSAEFIAYAVQLLARQSQGGRISVAGYSQGGLATQWALTFWPSVRQATMNFVGLASSFQGTILPQAACGALNVVGGCAPALLQMSTRSNFAQALARAGGQVAKVPSTSIFTFLDDLVLPQRNGPQGVSFLQGASNIALQEACPGLVVDHFGLIVSSATYGLALDALVHRRPTSLATFDRRFCNPVGDLFEFAQIIPRALQLTWRGLIGNPSTRVNMVLKTATTLSVPEEPRLQPYVCRWGLAQGCTFGYCAPQPRENVVKGVLGNNGLGGIIKGDGLRQVSALVAPDGLLGSVTRLVG